MHSKQTLIDKFFTDPDWSGVEELILSYIEPLKNMDNVDVNQPAEHVKAEIIGRQMAYECLNKFLNDNKLVKSKGNIQANPFK